jgi:hypothetical protein
MTKQTIPLELRMECPEEKQPRTFNYIGEQGTPWNSRRVYMCEKCLYCIEISPKQTPRLRT